MFRKKSEAELCPTDGEKDHWDGKDQARYYREMVAVRTPYEVERIAQFYRDFEVWLVDVRQEKNVP
jgi:7,8-dihydro-6-hydroxymethylpterin-pyrophosphokinase